VAGLRKDCTEGGTGSKLLEVNRQARRLPRAEREPPFPVTDARLLAIFWELHAARSHNGFSYNPFSYAELDAYQRLAGVTLTPWDVKMLKRIDTIYLMALQKAEKLKAKTHG